MEQSVGVPRGIGWTGIESTSVDAEQVDPAIDVVVEPGDSASHDFRQEEATGFLVVVEAERDTRASGDFDEPDTRGWSGRAGGASAGRCGCRLPSGLRAVFQAGVVRCVDRRVAGLTSSQRDRSGGHQPRQSSATGPGRSVCRAVGGIDRRPARSSSSRRAAHYPRGSPIPARCRS